MEHQFVPMRPIEGEEQPTNYSDAAIAELINSSIMNIEIPFIRKIDCVKNPRLGSVVTKVRSTTDMTTGTITNINAILRFNYPNDTEYIFENMILTTRMGGPGDSGSILVDNNKCAVGLLCSNANNSSSFCNLNTVLDQLDVRLA